MTMADTKKSSRYYNDRTLKILWGRAAGRCAVPECRVDLLVEETDFDPVVVIGEIAHLAASSEQGPRADGALSVKDRDDYENLVLLCRNCHARIDGQTHANPVAWIKKLKTSHEAWVRAALPERGKSTRGWLPVILQGEHPVDVEAALAALAPDFPAVNPIILSAPYTADWTPALAALRGGVDAISEAGDPFEKRFAVFPLAPVSACVALGYLLTDRPNVRLFQHHRQDRTWGWISIPTLQRDLTTAFPATPDSAAREIAICFHLSAAIAISDLPEQFANGANVVHVRVEHPSVQWLKEPAQLEWLTETAAEVFEQVGGAFPKAERWHIFYAGPAPGAVIVGQQLNPTMSPQTQLYEFARASQPRYLPSIVLAPA